MRITAWRSDWAFEQEFRDTWNDDGDYVATVSDDLYSLELAGFRLTVWKTGTHWRSRLTRHKGHLKKTDRMRYTTMDAAKKAAITEMIWILERELRD